MEFWKEIPGFEAYEASNEGEIRRKSTEKILKQQVDNRGYKVITIRSNNKKSTKKVARTIWAAFNNCDCKLTIDHIDRNKHNNNLSNLRCISKKDNSKNRDTYSYTNRNTYGLDDAKKTQIMYKLCYENYSTHRIWKEFGIPTNYMGSVIKRGSWQKYLNDEPNV